MTETKQAAGQKWPFDPPNGWDRDAARLLALIQMYPHMWLCLHRAKYIELRIDTRDCGFHLYDRDHKPLKPDEIVKAVEDLKAQFGDDGQMASHEYREGSRPEEPLLAELERLKADLATFGKDTVDTENRIIDAEFDAQHLRTSGEAFRLAMVQSGALNHVPQNEYFDQLRALEGALASKPAHVPVAPFPPPKGGWTCFHCGERFFTVAEAGTHFGVTSNAQPGCLIKVEKGVERGILAKVREVEQERDELEVRLTAARLGLDRALEDEAVERYRATRI